MKKPEHLIDVCTSRDVTKEELIQLIERNFPDSFGQIAVITTNKSDNGIFQSITFGKVLEF